MQQIEQNTQSIHKPWEFIDWPAPFNIKAIFTTRGVNAGMGDSQAPFNYFNLGDHVGDVATAVANNRQYVAQSLNIHMAYLRQVHGTQCTQISNLFNNKGLNYHLNGLVIDLLDLHGLPLEADAVWTRQARMACTVMVADCLPLLITNQLGTRVAAAHAGWRGLLGKDGYGIIESTFEHMRRMALGQEDDKDSWLVWLGPCIGKTAFEVGEDVFRLFVLENQINEVHFTRCGKGKYLADLAALARFRLLKLGVDGHSIFGNDGSQRWCTYSNATKFFSHRRDTKQLGSTGRMAASIWIEQNT